MSDDFFAELEAEIAVHTQRAEVKKSATAAKKRAANKTLSEVERAAADREWREYQAIIDAEIWQPLSSVAFFTEQVCDGCGSTHRVFLQYMEQQTTRRASRSHDKRWVRVKLPEPGLPKTTMVQQHHTHVCADCCVDHGFGFENADRFAFPQAIAISQTYLQGDINAAPEEG